MPDTDARPRGRPLEDEGSTAGRRAFTASRGASVLVTVLGLWLLAAPFVFHGSDAARQPAILVNELTIGTIVAGLGLARAGLPVTTRAVAWVNAAAGLWLALAPFLFGYLGSASGWNDIIVGVAILLAAAAGLLLARRSPSRRELEGARDLRQEVTARSRHGVAVAVALALAALAMIVFAVAGSV